MTFEELKTKVNGWFQPKNEAERAKLKKYAIVFPAMFLTFIVAIWLIFGSGFSSDKTDTSNANMELPYGDNAEIEGNKLKAMEAKALEDEKHRQDSVVQTFTEMADTMPTNISEEPTAIESSAQAYQSVQASLAIVPSLQWLYSLATESSQSTSVQEFSVSHSDHQLPTGQRLCTLKWYS